MALYLGTERVKIRTAPYVRYTVVGSPTITDGVASGFSSSDYLKTTSVFSSIDTFEIYLRVLNPETFRERGICGFHTYSGNFGFVAESNGSFMFRLATHIPGQSGTTEYVSILSNTSAQPSSYSRLYAKVDTINRTVYFKQMLDDETVQYSDTQAILDKTIIYGSMYELGLNQWGVFTGGIDLNNSYIKVNGQYWWKGDMQYAQTYTLHSTNDYGFDSEGRLVWANKNIWLRIPASQGSVQPSITTDYYPNNNTKIEAEIMGVDGTDMFGRSLVFAYSAGTSNKFGFRYNDSRKLNFYYNGTSYTTPNTYTTGVRTKITLDKNKAYVDDTLENTFTQSTFQSTYPIKIFGWSDALPYFYSGKVYSIKIYENDVLVRHFVPVPTGMQIGSYTVPSNGLFDIVTQTFFGNSGTGTFNYGKDE